MYIDEPGAAYPHPYPLPLCLLLCYAAMQVELRGKVHRALALAQSLPRDPEVAKVALAFCFTVANHEDNKVGSRGTSRYTPRPCSCALALLSYLQVLASTPLPLSGNCPVCRSP